MKKITIRALCAFLFLGLCMTGYAQPVPGKKYSDQYRTRYAEFEKERPVNSADIVFLGNSLTQGGKWNEYFEATQEALAAKGGGIRNRGIIGDDAPGIYDRLNQILPGRPAKIFLLVGVNDISHHIPADSVLFLAGKVVERIRRESPGTKLYLQSLLPVNERKNRYKSMTGKAGVIREVNEGLRKLAKSYRIKFICLYPHFKEKGSEQLKPALTNDGLHINEEGYRIWAKQIKKYVK